MLLNDGCFDSQKVVCHIHQWGFDGQSGKCVTHAHLSKLRAHPLQIESDEIQVDVGVKKARPAM